MVVATSICTWKGKLISSFVGLRDLALLIRMVAHIDDLRRVFLGKLYECKPR